MCPGRRLSHDPSFLRLDRERCELEAMGLICQTIQLSRVLKDNATRVLLIRTACGAENRATSTSATSQRASSAPITFRKADSDMRTIMLAAASRPDALLTMESDLGQQQRITSATSNGSHSGAMIAQLKKL